MEFGYQDTFFTDLPLSLRRGWEFRKDKRKQVSAGIHSSLIRPHPALWGSPLLRLMMRTSEHWARNQDSSMPCNLLALGHKIGYSLCHPGFLHLWMWAIYTSLTGVKGEEHGKIWAHQVALWAFTVLYMVGWIHVCIVQETMSSSLKAGTNSYLFLLPESLEYDRQ